MSKINKREVGLCINQWDSAIVKRDSSYDVFDWFYNKKNIEAYRGKPKDEIPLLVLNQYQLDEQHAIRQKQYLKRWSGTIVVDIDPPQHVKKDILKRSEANKCIDQMIEEFEEGFNYKTSASGIGLHLFQQVCTIGYSDDESFIARDLVYENVNELVTKRLAELSLSIDYQIDESMLDVNQAVMLNYTDRFRFYPIDFDIKPFKKAIQERIDLSKSKPKLTSELIRVQNETDLTTIIKGLISKMKGRVGSNNERWKIPFLLQQAGLGKDVWDGLYVLDNKTSKNEWDNYWTYAEGKERTLPVYLINQSLDILNSVADTKYQIKEGLVPDVTISVNRYVSEAGDSVSDYINVNDKILLEAATGSGKTSFIIEYIRGWIIENPSRKVVIAVDTKVLANQLEQKSKFSALHGDTITELIPDIKKQQVIICTYDSLNHVNGIDLLIVDEAHQLVSAAGYREKALKVLWDTMSGSKVKTVAISATTDYLFPLKKDFKHLKIDVGTSVKNSHYLLVTNDRKKPITKEDRILKHLFDTPLNGNKCVIYLNNSLQNLTALKERIEHQIGGYKVVVWHSELDDKEGMDQLLTNDVIDDDIDVVITTSIFQNGVNVLNADIERCYTDQLEKTALIQFSARFRKGGVNIFLLCNKNQSDKNLKGFDGYKQLKYAVNSRVQKLNKYQKKLNQYGKLIKKKESDITLDLDIVKNRYLVNDFGVSYSVMKHNESIYHKDPIQLNIIIDGEIVIENTLDQTLKKEQLERLKKEKEAGQVIILDNLNYIHEIFETDAYRFDSKIEFLTDRAKRFYKKYTSLCKSDFAIKKALEVKKGITYFKLSKAKSIKLLKETSDIDQLMYEVFFHVWSGLSQKNRKRFIKDLDALDGLRFLFMDALSNTIEENRCYKDDELRQIFTNCLDKYRLLNISTTNDRIRMSWIKTLFVELKTTNSKEYKGVSKSYRLKAIPNEFNKFIKTTIKYYSTESIDSESLFFKAA